MSKESISRVVKQAKSEHKRIARIVDGFTLLSTNMPEEKSQRKEVVDTCLNDIAKSLRDLDSSLKECMLPDNRDKPWSSKTKTEIGAVRSDLVKLMNRARRGKR